MKSYKKSYIVGDVHICSNSEREIIQLQKHEEYVYIPMSENERMRYAPLLLNACWRFSVEERFDETGHEIV